MNKQKTPEPTIRRRPALSRETSLAQRAYTQIREEILRGNFAVGDILSRRRLADQLNMSFLPITEALQRLEVEGLVESRPRIGTRVRIPTQQDVLDSFIIREALETQAARLSCANMTSKQRTHILKSARHLDELYRASEAEADDSPFLFSVRTYHMRFHMQLAEFSQCAKLVRAIEREQVLIYNWFFDAAAHRTAFPANFHSNLAKAICSGKLETADSAMREHVRWGLEGVKKTLANVEIEKGWRLKRAG
ncbi:MAG TPA: GntR family transcriptional regulator [Terracidiphilus sp.]|jgi:DNA-binding GntR family transcriptional regulator|nr:GntR family transcriptional regulator [Terracidiphilus sp.]